MKSKDYKAVQDLQLRYDTYLQGRRFDLILERLFSAREDIAVAHSDLQAPAEGRRAVEALYRLAEEKLEENGGFLRTDLCTSQVLEFAPEGGYAAGTWLTIGAVLEGAAFGNTGESAPFYLIFRGFKNRPVQMDRPKEFNAEQKRSLTIICIFLVLVIVPMLCNSVFGGPFFKWLSRYMDVQMLAIVGAIVCSFLKMGDEREILTRQVPWGLILLSGGIATFISVCSGAGAIQVISQWMTDTLPAWIVTPLLSAIGALISFVSDTINVGMNTFGATFPVLAETTGISMFALVEAFLLGGSFTAISPFSMGGSLALSLQPDESRRGRQFTGQILVAIGQALVVVLAALGFFNLFA